MKDAEKQPDTFFDHFAKSDKPTNIGMHFVKVGSRKMFDYAGLSAGDRVLEIGPGRGMFADICLEHGIEYHAIEANPTLAQSLEQRGAQVIQALVPPLPDYDKPFDAIIMLSVMEHMNSMQDALDLSKQIHDSLVDGGTFLLMSPEYLNWGYHFFNCDFSHNYVTTRRRLDQLMINAGFARTKSCYISGPFMGMPCIVLTAMMAWMPFGRLCALWPNSKLIYKLYKIQITFLRRVLIMGVK